MPPVLGVVAAVASVAGAAATVVGAGAILGISAATFSAIALGASIGASLLAPKPKAPQNSKENIDRLRASIDPRTPRKTWVGITAGATDIRDEEFSSDQAYFHRFIVVASHKANKINEIWFDNKLAWSLAAGVQGEFAGYLDVAVVLEGNAGNAINISGRMGSTRRYTGLAYVHLRYKLTGNTKKVDSPFAQSITTRITIRGEGAALYDPRQDTTIPGGSGSMRADDQSTWVWDADHCRNPALALLFYLLGYQINGKLAVGKGIPPNRIDLESFAVAANICDELVDVPGGGTEPRYRADGVWSEGDSPTTVIDMLKATMNADLDDVDGKLRLTIFRDDIAAPVADLGIDDILGQFDWQPFPALNESFNIVRGIFTDPSDASLYQPIDYPECRVDSPDGIDRIETFNLPMSESVTQARRLAQLRLSRQDWSGIFKAEFQATAWRVQKNSLVRLTFAPTGFDEKLFRVAEIDLRVDGVVPMTLIEEDPDLYVIPPDALPIIPIDGSVHDPLKDPVIDALNEAEEKLDDLADDLIDFSDDNDFNATTPPAVTGVTVTGQNFTDSSGLTTVTWSFTRDTDPEAASNIDGFLVGLMARTSSAGYTYSPSDNASIRWQTVPADQLYAQFPGTAVDLYATAMVFPFRQVHSTIDADNVIRGPVAQSSSSTPYRQASSPNFTGLINSVTAAAVADGASRALVGLTSGGNVGSGKVLTGSVATDAINSTVFVPQGALITFATSDSAGATIISGFQKIGVSLRTRFIFDQQIQIMDPNTGDQATITVKMTATNLSSGTTYTSGTFTVTQVWNTSSASGLKSFPRDSIGLEWTFDSLPSGFYDIGYEVTTDSRAGLRMDAYRYQSAEDNRAKT